ncbi:MAG TPA: hypothetical protein VGR81_07835 [Candidatus Acidoferrales bacterium]|nr:hypothetical protein [Candidatus Acidoferrales bacterium]
MNSEEQPASACRVDTDPAVLDSAGCWNATTRVAFRFCFLYLGLYILFTQMLTSLFFAATNDNGAFEVDYTRPVQAVIVWIGHHVFGIAHPILTALTGSGDRLFDWIELPCILALAIAGTIVWSALDGRREGYGKLYSWFYVILRFALSATMLSYGAAKILPLQMPFPSLNRLLEPYGNLSPMGVLWASIGASQAYEVFAGAAEMLGGILLIFPRTTTLGALVCLADATQVFLLNMTYDVPVKILAFHLILVSAFLLAGDSQRLCSVFFSERPAPASPKRLLFRGERANRIALIVQILFGLWLVGANLYGSISVYNVYGPGAPKSPLHGIWNVQELTVDGQPHPPLLTDAERWRRLVFDSPRYMTIQDMNETAKYYLPKVDMTAKTIKLSKSSDKNWSADFSFSEPSADEMILDGSMDGHKIHADLQLFDRTKFLLVTRGFHWVQDYPFNR